MKHVLGALLLLAQPFHLFSACATSRSTTLPFIPSRCAGRGASLMGRRRKTQNWLFSPVVTVYRQPRCSLSTARPHSTLRRCTPILAHSQGLSILGSGTSLRRTSAHHQQAITPPFVSRHA